MAWSKFKPVVYIGAGFLLVGGAFTIGLSEKNLIFIGDSDIDIAATSNLLVNPPGFEDCIYSKTLPATFDQNNQYQYETNIYRVGYCKNNFYVLNFSDTQAADRCVNVRWGEGRYGDIYWSYSSGILVETNKGDGGWLSFAIEPLKLGIAPVNVGTVKFQSPTNFFATDFLGDRIVGTLTHRILGGVNQCIISYRIDGVTNSPVWSVTLDWQGREPSTIKLTLPERVVQRVEQSASASEKQIVVSEIVIHKIVYASEGLPASRFSPKQIAGGKLKIIATFGEPNVTQ